MSGAVSSGQSINPEHPADRSASIHSGVSSGINIRAKLIMTFVWLLGSPLGLGLFSIGQLATVNAAAAADLPGSRMQTIRALGKMERVSERWRVNQALDVLDTTDQERSAKAPLTRAQIAQIQSATKEAMDGTRVIMKTIDEVSEISLRISAAVKEQRTATAEIARSVQRTSQSTTAVAATIGSLSEAATEVGTTSTEVLAAAGLSRRAEQPNSEIDRFTAEVWAA